MWLSVLAALVCFAVAIIMFTPPLRPFPFYKSISFFFLFEGLWCLLNGALHEIIPYSDLMMWVQYVGIVIFAGYIFFSVFSFHRREQKKSDDKKLSSGDAKSNEKDNSSSLNPSEGIQTKLKRKIKVVSIGKNKKSAKKDSENEAKTVEE